MPDEQDKDKTTDAAKDTFQSLIDDAVNKTLVGFKDSFLNLQSESAQAMLTSVITTEVFSSLWPLIEDVISENESLWFMLDEMKAADVKNNPFIAEELNSTVDSNMARIRFMMTQKGEA
jgi:hypothetical protein